MVQADGAIAPDAQGAQAASTAPAAMPRPGLSQLPDSVRVASLSDRGTAGDGVQWEPNGRTVGRESNGYEPDSAYPRGIYRS
jgi:hypothetical protein